MAFRVLLKHVYKKTINVKTTGNVNRIHLIHYITMLQNSLKAAEKDSYLYHVRQMALIHSTVDIAIHLYDLEVLNI